MTDKVSDITIDEYTYEKYLGKNALIAPRKIAKFKISNTSRIFVLVLRKLLISKIQCYRLNCVSHITFFNNGYDIMTADELKLRIETLDISDDIPSDSVFSLKVRNDTLNTMDISTNNFECVNNKKIKFSNYANHISQITKLLPGGYINIDEFNLVKGCVSDEHKFTVVSSVGLKLPDENTENDIEENGRDYVVILRYIEKYGIKQLMLHASDRLKEIVDMVKTNITETETHITIQLDESKIIQNILEYYLMTGDTVYPIKFYTENDNRYMMIKDIDIKKIYKLLDEYKMKMESFVNGNFS